MVKQTQTIRRNNSNSRQIVWICLTILLAWRLKGYCVTPIDLYPCFKFYLYSQVSFEYRKFLYAW